MLYFNVITFFKKEQNISDYYFQITHCSLQGLLCDLGQKFQLSPPSVSTRVTTREHPAAESGTMGEKRPRILPKMPNSTLHLGDLLHVVKLRHEADGFTSPQKEVVLRIFFALKKIRRLRPGANPRTQEPTTSTLPLNHRSRLNISDTFVCVRAAKMTAELKNHLQVCVQNITDRTSKKFCKCRNVGPFPSILIYIE